MVEWPKIQTAQLSAIDRATLTPLVRRALNSSTVELISWDLTQLHGGAGGGTVYRFSGEGRDQDRPLTWSMILKVVQPLGRSSDTSTGTDYRREADAYQSGWLDELPGNLAAPCCYGVTDSADRTCLMWLEDITDDIGARWPLEHYGIAARHLGQFNGAYLVGGSATARPALTWSWLRTGGLRKGASLAAPAMLVLRDSLDHPLVRRWFPSDAGERMLRLWKERELYLDALDRLPQTLCHSDAFRRNLFAREIVGGDYETVAVDWAYVGWGAIGEELVPLVQASISFLEVDVAQAGDLEDIVFEGYLKGLEDAGWQGDPRQVRLGYAAASLRYGFAGVAALLSTVLDESLHDRLEQATGHSIAELCDHMAEVGRYHDSLTDEARELMDILG